MIVPLIATLRPRQWTKNLLLFTGVLFSRQLDRPELLGRATAGFLTFCVLSGLVYLLNDLRDVEEDRRHPTKRRRPIASGALSVRAARAALVVLFLVSVALSVSLGPRFAIVAGGYLLVNLAYSVVLKERVLLDVFAIATGFVLRAIAGVTVLLPLAPATALSPWLLVCTFFGALFLALGKRRREVANAGELAARQRQVLDRYTPELLDGLLLISAATSVMGYVLYTIWPATVAKFGTEALLFTVPFVAYGIFRYLFLVGFMEDAEDPSAVLLRDRPLAICVLLYLATVAAILYGS